KKHEVFLLESGCLSGPVTSALSSADLPRTEGEQRPSLSIIGRLFSPHPPFGDVPSVGNNLRPSPIPGNEPPVTAIAAPSSRSRYKRCTCYSYKDKECVYYCHLDVIWINSPELQRGPIGKVRTRILRLIEKPGTGGVLGCKVRCGRGHKAAELLDVAACEELRRLGGECWRILSLNIRMRISTAESVREKVILVIGCCWI
uniref:Endothelin-3 n=1 Tax=Callorhinchus milii TaxID=7868 RepID=A0A4W3JXS3_CALMI